MTQLVKIILAAAIQRAWINNRVTSIEAGKAIRQLGFW